MTRGELVAVVVLLVLAGAATYYLLSSSSSSSSSGADGVPVTTPPDGGGTSGRVTDKTPGAILRKDAQKGIETVSDLAAWLRDHPPVFPTA